VKLKISGPGDQEVVFENYDPARDFAFPAPGVGWFAVEIWSDDGNHLYSFEPIQCVPSDTINVQSLGNSCCRVLGG
jgi:hypothetical protein